MIWFLWTIGIGMWTIAVTIMIMLWWDATSHRRAMRRRVSEYLAKLANDD